MPDYVAFIFGAGLSIGFFLIGYSAGLMDCSKGKEVDIMRNFTPNAPAKKCGGKKKGK